MKRLTAINLRRVNNFLTVVAVLLAVYIIAVPFLPQVWWWGGHAFRKPNLAMVQVTKTNIKKPTNPIPAGYWLDIPRLDMHTPLYTGRDTYAELDKGVWVNPSTSTPDKGSNTVVAGHRFTYTNPRGIFYFLDKVQLNDRVTVDWNGTEYTYQVSNIQIVLPTDGSVNAPTKDTRFTMYTCTPILTHDHRLIVTAELVSKRTS